MAVHVRDGIFYHDGYFVSAGSQSIILRTADNNFAHNLQTCKVALKVDKSVINIDDDSTLGDPNRDTNNWNAPGADRLKIDLTLSQVYSDSLTDDYILLMDIQTGRIVDLRRATEYS